MMSRTNPCGRLPVFDQAISALIEDIHARGMDRKVMVIASGEFGRSPRINPQNGTSSGVMQPGRDHGPERCRCSFRKAA